MGVWVPVQFPNGSPGLSLSELKKKKTTSAREDKKLPLLGLVFLSIRGNQTPRGITSLEKRENDLSQRQKKEEHELCLSLGRMTREQEKKGDSRSVLIER